MHAFMVVAEELSFRRAAERLQMAQPPLSQQIKRLEREVGVELLHRNTRHVALTAAGEAFLGETRKALAATRAAPHVAHQAASGEIGVVRLGFTGPASYWVLLLIVRKFRRLRPDVRLDIVGPSWSGELVDRIHREDVDAALVRLPIRSSAVRIHEITRDPYLAVLPTDHPLAQQDEISIPDLREQPIIGYPSNRGAASPTAIHSGFMEHGISPNIVQEAPDTHTIMLLAGAGGGIGLVLRPAEHLKVPGVALVPVPELPALPLALAWRERDHNPALNAIHELLDEVADESTAV